VEAEAGRAHQGLAGDLHENTPIERLGVHQTGSPLRLRTLCGVIARA
jgi:hypothetical protein